VSHKATLNLLPFCIWIVFFSLLLEPDSSLSARFIRPLFSNPFTAWLGKISYSIYLSHALILVGLQWALLRIWPNATQSQHLFLLVALGILGTVGVSAVLYNWIEKPFIQLGKKLTSGTATPMT
jgi:peptidoglycan/LPS O-acetylase OafA/YrhL